MKEERHSKMEIQKLSVCYSVRRLDKDDVDSIYELSRRNKIFYQYHPPFVTKESILEDMEALPPNKTREDKYYLGYFQKDTLVAVMDLILGYPNEKVAFIGFFMMDTMFQGKGIGTELISECTNYLAQEGYEKIRLAIDKGNPQSEAFWTKIYFVKTGEEYPNEISTYLPMEREI